LKATLEHIKRIVEWRKNNPEKIKEISYFDIRKIDEELKN